VVDSFFDSISQVEYENGMLFSMDSGVKQVNSGIPRSATKRRHNRLVAIVPPMSSFSCYPAPLKSGARGNVY
jgi:hypothetical protein